MDSTNSKYIKEVEKSYTSLQYFLKLLTCITYTTAKNRGEREGKAQQEHLHATRTTLNSLGRGNNLAKSLASLCNSAESKGDLFIDI